MLNDLSTNQVLQANQGDWPEPFLQAAKILEATRGMGEEAQKDAITYAKRELGTREHAWRLFEHGETRRCVMRLLECKALHLMKRLVAIHLCDMLLGPAGGVSQVCAYKTTRFTY